MLDPPANRQLVQPRKLLVKLLEQMVVDVSMTLIAVQLAFVGIQLSLSCQLFLLTLPLTTITTRCV